MSVYESIIQGIKEAIEYEKGNSKARTVKCNVDSKESSASMDKMTILEEATLNELHCKITN